VEDEEGVTIRMEDPATRSAIVVEDDGRVAYAYLLENGRIVGDVWLYNVADAPVAPEWSHRSKLPFLNPAPFCRNDISIPRVTDVAIRCVWLRDQTLVVDVFFSEVHVARLRRGAKPGWSLLAAREGPLAKRLSESGATPEA